MKKQKGFSLVELMVVVAVIGALTAIAIPQYQKFTEKSEATAAIASLSSLKTIIETEVAENGTFPAAANDAAYIALGVTKYDGTYPAFKPSETEGKEKGGTMTLTISKGDVTLTRDENGFWTCAHPLTGVKIKGCTTS
ncbi:prepilin-type N-terminal cleavage/methylation domain-containing protein [Enterovibrio sp. Hal110]